MCVKTLSKDAKPDIEGVLFQKVVSESLQKDGSSPRIHPYLSDDPSDVGFNLRLPLCRYGIGCCKELFPIASVFLVQLEQNSILQYATGFGDVRKESNPLRDPN